MIKMFGDRSRIRKVAIVEDKAAMLPKVFVEMVLGRPNVLFATFFTVNMVNEVIFLIYTLRGQVYVVFLWWR